MDKQLIDTFKIYAKSNLRSIKHPSRNASIPIDELDAIIDLLFSVLYENTDEEVFFSLLQIFRQNFLKIKDFQQEEVSTAIQILATNFEAFLRKIAFLKYKDEELLYGNSETFGIKELTLADLLKSQTKEKKENGNYIDFPSLLVSQKGITAAIYNRVRELRNDIHHAKSYNRQEQIEYSNLILGAYMLAVVDNKDILQKQLLPEYKFLEAIINSPEFNVLDKSFIELTGEETTFSFDNIVIELLPPDKLLRLVEYGEEEADDKELQNLRVDTINIIAKDSGSFLIVGEPGSGKTTSLKNIFFLNASEILKGSKDCKFPIYIQCHLYTEPGGVDLLLKQSLASYDLPYIRSKYKVLIIIDGLNEIRHALKRKAFNEIRSLFVQYDDFDFILSSRKNDDISWLNLPVFELKKLDDVQIRNYLSNKLDKEKQDIVWQQLINSKQLIDIARNPLHLAMLTALASINKISSSLNRGLVFRNFTNTLLTRERKFYNTRLNTKIDLLSDLAFWMRSNGFYGNTGIIAVKDVITIKLKKVDHSIGINEIV